MGLLLIMITFSRAAILSYIIIVALFVLIRFRWKRTIVYFGVSLALLILLAPINIFHNLFEYALYKEQSSLFTSRFVMYNMSIKAAGEGGVIGFGYGMSDPNYFNSDLCKINHGVLVREKGSSILALIEEVGWVGLILFFLPQVYLLLKMIQKLKFLKNKKGAEKEILELSLFISLMIGLIIHSQLEAWAVGVGSVMLPLYLLLLFYMNKKFNQSSPPYIHTFIRGVASSQ